MQRRRYGALFFVGTMMLTSALPLMSLLSCSIPLSCPFLLTGRRWFASKSQNEMSDNFQFQQLAADTLPPLAEATQHRVRRAQELVAKLGDGASVLDVGCSDGTILAPFVGRLKVHGIDGSDALVAAARAKGILARG